MSDPGIFGTGLKNELKNPMLKLLIFHNNIGESKKKFNKKNTTVKYKNFSNDTFLKI